MTSGRFGQSSISGWGSGAVPALRSPRGLSCGNSASHPLQIQSGRGEKRGADCSDKTAG